VIELRRGDKIVVASHNPGKVREIRELLAPVGLQILGAAELNLPEPEETGSTFAENAKLKADAAARVAGMPALSDDSGLCVAALDGAPGIYSARWAGPAKDFRLAMQRVENEVGGNPDKRAYFVCVLALAAPNAETDIFEGRVYGSLTFPPRGDRGFGYDPIFLPENGRFTFGEMDPRAKHANSHRARAFAKFAAAAIHPSTEQ
jgi:XTP/dITP diphosphohydrolase